MTRFAAEFGCETVAHTALCFPFAALVVRARMAAGFDRSTKEAAKDLSAGGVTPKVDTAFTALIKANQLVGRVMHARCYLRRAD